MAMQNRLNDFSRRLRRIVSRSLQPLLRKAAEHYIAGPELADALHVAQHLRGAGVPTTLGFWDGPGHDPADVQAQYLAGLQTISEYGLDSYESIKFPALRCDRDWLDPVVASAVDHNVRLHFDSLADTVADATWQAAIEAKRAGARVSCSVPGRWRRSRGDCLWAIEAGVLVRVVKGQWPDSTDPTLDPRAGFLSVIDELAGRVPLVAVATHDVALGRSAIERLRAAGTPCEWELLYGLPSRAARAAARALGATVRLYVPYGEAYLPYCLSQARRNPRLVAKVVWDACQRVPAADPLCV
jgi:proline dehydrogenase